MNGAAQTFIVPQRQMLVMLASISASVGVGELCLRNADRGHDLPRLAVAALRNVFRDPRLLHRVAVVGRRGLRWW